MEVLGNIEAMEASIRLAAGGGQLRTADLLEIHSRLMAASAHPHLGGWVRDVQNWIGVSAYTPVGASYIPPPGEEVSDLLEDLIAYVNRSDIPPLIQAGIAHAQFETIHPFADGNGRAGRALIHAVLRRRGLAPVFVPPISAALARSPNTYFDGLATYRYLGAADDPARDHAAEQWLEVFLDATYDACHEAQRYLSAISALEADLRARAGPIRRGSAADLLLGLLPARPVFTVTSAAATIRTVPPSQPAKPSTGLPKRESSQCAAPVNSGIGCSKHPMSPGLSPVSTPRSPSKARPAVAPSRPDS